MGTTWEDDPAVSFEGYGRYTVDVWALIKEGKSETASEMVRRWAKHQVQSKVRDLNRNQDFSSHLTSTWLQIQNFLHWLLLLSMFRKLILMSTFLLRHMLFGHGRAWEHSESGFFKMSYEEPWYFHMESVYFSLRDRYDECLHIYDWGCENAPEPWLPSWHSIEKDGDELMSELLHLLRWGLWARLG
jgi:hypothetical protein